jgi:hypothetical protein
MSSKEREVTPFTSADKASSAATRGSGNRPVVSDHLEAQRKRNRAWARIASVLWAAAALNEGARCTARSSVAA